MERRSCTSSACCGNLHYTSAGKTATGRNGRTQRVRSDVSSPRIAASGRRPDVECAAYQCDLADVIAVVHGSLPENGVDGAAGGTSRESSLESDSAVAARAAKRSLNRVISFPHSVSPTRASVRQPASRSVLRVRRLFPADPAQFIVGPEIHMPKELIDRVREIRNAPHGGGG